MRCLGPRTRLLESALKRTLQFLLDGDLYPRSLFQVILQLVREPSDDSTTATPAQQRSILPVLPHTLNAAVCALLNGNIAMSTVAVAVAVWTYDRDCGSSLDIQSRSRPVSVRASHSPDEKLKAVHVFAYTAKWQMLLAESEGNVTFDEWDEAAALGELECLSTDKNHNTLMSWLKSMLTQDIVSKTHWKGAQ